MQNNYMNKSFLKKYLMIAALFLGIMPVHVVGSSLSFFRFVPDRTEILISQSSSETHAISFAKGLYLILQENLAAFNRGFFSVYASRLYSLASELQIKRTRDVNFSFFQTNFVNKIPLGSDSDQGTDIHLL
jgi:hypothetical protein